MKAAVNKSYTEWRVNGDAASRDCHAENVTSFQRLKRQKKSQYADNLFNAQISIKSGIFGSCFLESVENSQQQCFCDASSSRRMVRALLETILQRTGTTIITRVGREAGERANGRDQYRRGNCGDTSLQVREGSRSGRVIFFPITAPGMGRFKLFNLVGYS